MSDPVEEKRDFVTVSFRCDGCGLIQAVTYETNYGDSLDHHCPDCGRYYKKSHRIDESQILDRKYFTLSAIVDYWTGERIF
ncbi:MAG: hypothetical protein ACRD3W_30355 [Terriglobales bacterium]